MLLRKSIDYTTFLKDSKKPFSWLASDVDADPLKIG